MEFTEYTCPVCNKRFVNGDDVVVCPDCGAPHHRECWDKTERCFYAERHAAGFSFENAGSEETDSADNGENAAGKTLICPRCGAENAGTDFFCGTCGFPLNEKDKTEPPKTEQTQNRAHGTPFGFGSAGAPMYDPMAGMKSDEEIAPNVNVGEAAKFIGKNTPYYLLVFKRIKQFGSGKFNFSAFLFTGAFFIYRKMYVHGIILILAMIGITVGSTAITMSNTWMTQMEYNDLVTGIYGGTLGAGKMNMLMLSAGLSLLRYGIMVFSGLSANKLYYKHCAKNISLMKQNNKDGGLNKELETRGGVNLPMAISFFAAFAVIYELCNYYLLFQL